MLPNRKNTHLCVGGPLDRQQFCSLRDTGFAIQKRIEGDSYDEGEEDPVVVKSEQVTYRREVFKTNNTEISIWVSDDLTFGQALEKVLAAYMKKP